MDGKQGEYGDGVALWPWITSKKGTTRDFKFREMSALLQSKNCNNSASLLRIIYWGGTSTGGQEESQVGISN